MLSAMTGYAATALGYLAVRRGAAARIPDIARARAIPRPYLAKIVRALSARGIVRTQRGVGGGVALALDPRRLSLLDLCHALEDPVLLPHCVLGQATCSAAHACPLHAEVQAIRARELELLAGTNVLALGEFDAARLEKRRARGRRKA